MHLPLDHGSVRDTSGYVREVSANGAVPGQGEFSGCFCFDGRQDYIRVSDFHYGPQFTISFWFNHSDNSGKSYQYMFSHGPIHERNSGSYYFIEDGNGNYHGEIKTNLLDRNDHDRAELFNTPKGLTDGTWHLYTVSVAKVGATVYIDGREIKSADQGGDPIDPTGDIIIGGRSDLHKNRFYKGYLDDIRLYDHALGADEVAALFRLGR